jgi:hypothetical protein
MRVRLLVVCALACLGAACSGGGDAGRDVSEVPSTWTIAGSFDRCTTRLAFAEATYAIDRPALQDEEHLERLRSINPPSELAADWPSVLEAAEQALGQKVEVEDIDDTELSDRAIAVVRAVDHLVVNSPCDPTGLAEDFGCREPMRACVDQLIAGDGSGFSTTFALEIGRAAPWDDVQCFDEAYYRERGVTDIEPQPYCILEHSELNHQQAQSSITFASTSDDRLIAWGTN